MFISSFEQPDNSEEIKENENSEREDDTDFCLCYDLKKTYEQNKKDNETATTMDTKRKENEIVKINVIEKKNQMLNKKRKKNKEIFYIKKKIKKGRPKKGINYKGKHNKNYSDNIVRKIKRAFINYSKDYINKKYDEYLGKSNIKKSLHLLKPISQKEIIDLNPERNLEWFQKPLKDIFSVKLSKKIKIFPSDYNKRNIDELYKDKNAKVITDILNLTVKKMYEKFISEGLPFFLEKVGEKMKIEKEEEVLNHKRELEKMAKNLENFFEEIHFRKINKKTEEFLK